MADKTRTPQEPCALCGDASALLHIHARCHPAAPLRAEIEQGSLLALYCYVPECNRFVARFQVKQIVK